MSNKDLIGSILQSTPHHTDPNHSLEHTPESVADVWIKMKKKKKVQLVVSIDPELMNTIEKMAFTKGSSKSRVVEEALEKGIKI